jgi:hypothetical protein
MAVYFELACYLPDVIVTLIDSFFARAPSDFLDHHAFFIVGHSGHPEYAFAGNTDWDFTFKGLVAGGHTELIPAYIANMKIDIPSRYKGYMWQAFAAMCAKGDREMMAVLAPHVEVCGFCAGPIAAHVARVE